MNARRRLLAILLAAIAVGPAVSSWAQKPQKKVLVIHSRRRDTEFSIVADQRMPGLLDQGMGRKVDYYSEHIDANRFSEEKYKGTFSDYLARKYRGVHFDLVIATHQLAFDLVSSYRNKLFPNTPVVYLTEDRGIQQDVLRTATELVDRPPDDLLHALRKPPAADRRFDRRDIVTTQRRVLPAAQDLLDEERVAIRVAM